MLLNGIVGFFYSSVPQQRSHLIGCSKVEDEEEEGGGKAGKAFQSEDLGNDAMKGLEKKREKVKPLLMQEFDKNYYIF